jgi:hypothetical protein
MCSLLPGGAKPVTFSNCFRDTECGLCLAFHRVGLLFWFWPALFLCQQPTAMALSTCKSHGKRSKEYLFPVHKHSWGLRCLWAPLGRGLVSCGKRSREMLLVGPTALDLSPPLMTDTLNFSPQLITNFHTLSHTKSSRLHFKHLC